jgi:hypothetical protein
MPEDHKTVLLSILGTVAAGVVVLLLTVAISGGISAGLIDTYVLPLFISAFALTTFWAILFAAGKGKLPWLGIEMNEKGPSPAKESSMEESKTSLRK